VVADATKIIHNTKGTLILQESGCNPL
jgi:hypothetical protein